MRNLSALFFFVPESWLKPDPNTEKFANRIHRNLKTESGSKQKHRIRIRNPVSRDTSDNNNIPPSMSNERWLIAPDFGYNIEFIICLRGILNLLGLKLIQHSLQETSFYYYISGSFLLILNTLIVFQKEKFWRRKT